MAEISVCAVVVTHNRPELLRRCVAALFAQDRQPDAVLVVDNASEKPAESVLSACKERRLHVRRLAQNTGGAGGFYTGLRWAFDRGHGAAWLMDDDGTPDVDCLRELLLARARSGMHVLSPLVVDEADGERLSFGLLLGRGMGKQWIRSVADAEALAGRGDGLIRGPVNAFNGTLIDAAGYATIGDIKAECFIWGDDVEYTERAMARRVEMATVASARHRHPANRTKTVRLGPLGGLRVCPAERSHFYYRNLGYIYSRYRTPGFRAAKFVGYLGLTLAVGSPREAAKFWRYYSDGARDRYALAPSRADLLAQLAP
jgi:rhamnopyranosyl-N-acetylglucosaminyl-diphospho-decaprenol beta-1,3/1,4-galactofuranosyltransferase